MKSGRRWIMWTLGGGAQYAGQNDAGFVALIGLMAALAALAALVIRSVEGRRRRHGRPSDYS
jgi:hypothetical protein